MADETEPDTESDYDKKRKELFVFGRNVSQIPCFRNSFLYGIGGGLGLGLMRFMFSSQVLKSVNFAIYSFSFVTLAYWMPCRYNYSKKKFEYQRLEQQMRQHALQEGTEEEKVLRAQLKDAVSV